MQAREPALDVQLPPTVDAPSLAREHVLDLMGRMSPELREDARLVVSELVTAALTSPDEPLPMRLRVESQTPFRMAIEHIRTPDPRAAPIRSTPSLWGRELVASIAGAWSVTVRDGRMSAWAELRPGR